MNILLISQCQKSAIKETTRIIDQFAQRSGDKVWQTTITQKGLDTLNQMLRKTARKNTAVACYWTHGKNKTDLLWIIGNRHKFNEQGKVPTNISHRNILKENSENDWQYHRLIQIAASFAALLHDLGKATDGFQNKLLPQDHQQAKGDPYRHEWLSLRLFQRMIQGCQTDENWLKRLNNWQNYQNEHPNWHTEIILEKHDNYESNYDFSHFPPFARMIAWLIVSHHRLPFIIDYYEYTKKSHKDSKNSFKLKQQKNNSTLLNNAKLQEIFNEFEPITHWVKNENIAYSQYFRLLKADPTSHPIWQKRIIRWSNEALKLIDIQKIPEDGYHDPLLMHLSRLCLMAGDHYYSSLKKNDKSCINLKNPNILIANTNNDKTAKQSLDEHLCGVEKYSKEFAYYLPNIAEKLEGISNGTHKILRKRSTLAAFKWQNKAYDEAAKWQIESEQQGFFAVNIASTGCGKTLGNIKIMSALNSRPEGMRCTIALGLRTLTLQTGAAIADLLHNQPQPFNESELATLIGSQAIKALFTQQHQVDQGSESQQDYFSAEESLIAGINNYPDNPQLNALLGSDKMRQLLFTPLVTCTIDHLMEISEQKRGGRYVAPMLRLLSSDLILDEPDEFSTNDLPALTRLVYWSGLLGSRLILSSATLAPDFVTGLYRAYRDGRRLYNRHHGRPTANIVCAWFDEANQQSGQYDNSQAFIAAHQQFCKKRIKMLAKQPIRRKAQWLTLENANNEEIAAKLLQSAQQLHDQPDNHQIEPRSHKKISLGLIRIANIKNIINIAQAINQQTPLENTQIHLACYHSQQLLMMRSALESQLDRILNRKNPQALFEHLEIKSAIENSDVDNHIFIVLGSPVTEVGRDHDYDWAIIEPSSARSVIQIAGRVWRHRPEKNATDANILIFRKNIKALKQQTKARYTRPGFENETIQGEKFLLDDNSDLLDENFLNNINASIYLKAPEQEQSKQQYQNFINLEHAVFKHITNRKEGFVAEYRDYHNHYLAMLADSSIVSPFRASAPQTTYIMRRNYNDQLFLFEQETINPDFPDDFQQHTPFNDSPIKPINVKPWLSQSYQACIERLKQQFKEEDEFKIAIKYANINLNNLPNAKKWHFDEWLGFYSE